MNTDTHHWVPDVSAFDARLVLVRHAMGWNLKEAAMACGISPQSWRDWELSARRPRDFEAVCGQIAERTGCDLVWLMTGRRPTHEPPPGQRTTSTDGDDVVMLPRLTERNRSSPLADSDEIADDANRYVALAEGEVNIAPPPGLEPGTLRTEVAHLALAA